MRDQTYSDTVEKLWNIVKRLLNRLSIPRGSTFII